MLRLSKKTMYSIEAVLDIAYHSGGALVQSRDVTRRQGIPNRYLEQALQQLVRQGILFGVRGPKGGYRLIRERRRISIGDIVRAVRENGGHDARSGAAAGSELGSVVVRPLLQELQDALIQRMGAITIDDLCQRASKAEIQSEGWNNLDFSI